MGKKRKGIIKAVIQNKWTFVILFLVLSPVLVIFLAPFQGSSIKIESEKVIGSAGNEYTVEIRLKNESENALEVDLQIELGMMTISGYGQGIPFISIDESRPRNGFGYSRRDQTDRNSHFG